MFVLQSGLLRFSVCVDVSSASTASVLCIKFLKSFDVMAGDTHAAGTDPLAGLVFTKFTETKESANHRKDHLVRAHAMRAPCMRQPGPACNDSSVDCAYFDYLHVLIA